jgi:hypothetical protein
LFRFIPCCSTLRLHCRMPAGSTAQKRRGFRTQHCRTPALIIHMSLSSDCSSTCPYWFECNFPSSHTRWSETDHTMRPKALAKEFRHKPSIDKIGLTLHIGICDRKLLPNTREAVNKCSSMRLPRWNTCCSSGWCSSRVSPRRCRN